MKDLRAGWRVPEALHAQLAIMKSALEKGLPGLDSNDVGRATAELDQVRNALGESARTNGRAWLAAINQLDALLDNAGPLLGADAEQLKSIAKGIPDSLATALDQLDSDPSLPIELVQPVLSKLHATSAHVENFLSNAKIIIERQLAGWRATLDAVKLPKPELWNKWVADSGSFAVALHEAGSDPVPRLETLPSLAKSVLADLNKTLIEQVREADQNALKALFEAGKYSEAIAKVVLLNTVPGAAVAERQGGHSTGEDALAVAPGSVSAGLETVTFTQSTLSMPSLAYGFTAAPSGGLSSLAVLVAMSRRTVEATGMILTVVYAVLIAGAGYFLFADKWVGTPFDFALVSFWAFATDVGADAATAAARG